MPKRAAFITIGQTPRDDIVPELLATIGDSVDILELGLLDGLQPDDIAALRPADSEQQLVTRLRTGAQAIVGRAWAKKQLQSLLHELTREDFAFKLVLCTERLGPLRSKGVLLDAHSLVNHGVEAIAGRLGSLGVIVPLPSQVDEIRRRARQGRRVMATHASPYALGELEEAAKALRQTDLIVMDCMGYTEAMRETVARTSGRPVLLARRLVAAAVKQLL
jgi:protein AroM